MKIHHLVPALLLAGLAAHAAEFTNAEVKKVDVQQKKFLLQHDPIKDLGMPAMTMNYEAKDPALLAKFKAGDRVRVKVSQEGKRYFVTEMQPAK